MQAKAANGRKCTDTKTGCAQAGNFVVQPEPCTHSHCCADRRDACYVSGGARSVCARAPATRAPMASASRCGWRASVDVWGEYLRARSGRSPAPTPCCPLLLSSRAVELGQCSGAFQDCHFSACCSAHRPLLPQIRGLREVHGPLQHEGARGDWLCRRELPDEVTKLDCPALRLRENICKQLPSSFSHRGHARSPSAPEGVYAVRAEWRNAHLRGQRADRQCSARSWAELPACARPPPSPEAEAGSSPSLERHLSAGSFLVVTAALVLIGAAFYAYG